MLSLTEPSLTEVSYHGKDYPLNLTFDAVITLYGLLDNSDIASQVDALYQLLSRQGTVNDDNQLKLLLINTVLDYLSEKPYGTFGGAVDLAGNVLTDDDTPPDFDFEQDSAAIYASFRQYYGIDLNEERGNMHWDTFIALFDNLGPETPINRIRSIRNDDLSDYQGEDNVQRLQNMKELQSYYMLDSVRGKLDEETTADPFAGIFGIK